MKRLRDSAGLPLFCGLILLLCAFAAMFIGVIHIPADVVLSGLCKKAGLAKSADIPEYYLIAIWQLRLPRILMSLLAGGVLAVCGCVFQSIFRNPICEPYILGISAGASLGAAVSFILGWDIFVMGITLPALTTALLTLLFIMAIARLRRRHSTETLLLAGIALNFLISAVITLLMVVNQKEMQKIMFWTMGSLSTVSWHEIIWLFPVAIIAAAVLYYHAKDLNIMQLGVDSAQTLGVNVRRTTCIMLVTTSIMTAMVVSFCGVIGFIGLIMPHIARLIFGSDNRRLFTYSILFGAFFLLVADTIARTVAAPFELPVGSITALVGAPYFIFLLLKK